MDRETLVGALVLMLAVLAGLGLGWWLASLPISIEAGLGFAGALSGGALAVIGAVVVVSWEKLQRAKEHREVMHVLADEAIEWSERLLATKAGEDLEEQEWQAALAFISTIDRLKASRAWFPPQTIGMAKAYSTIETVFTPPEELRRALVGDAFMLAIQDLKSVIPLTQKLLMQARWELQIHRQEPAERLG